MRDTTLQRKSDTSRNRNECLYQRLVNGERWCGGSGAVGPIRGAAIHRWDEQQGSGMVS